jgi:EAL domain-containing protein (putative c-di-GMP-specific phosphodiesterase class I)
MAKSLSLAVTSEGIETTEQLHQLLELGCDRGQGFYFARPLPPEAFDRSLWQDCRALLTSPRPDPTPPGSTGAAA